jgi:hypothetical protein
MRADATREGVAHIWSYSFGTVSPGPEESLDEYETNEEQRFC